MNAFDNKDAVQEQSGDLSVEYSGEVGDPNKEPVTDPTGKQKIGRSIAIAVMAVCLSVIFIGFVADVVHGDVNATGKAIGHLLPFLTAVLGWLYGTTHKR